LETFSLNKEVLLPRSLGIPGQADSGPFQRDLVRKILVNRFYTGVVPYYGKLVDGSEPESFSHIFPGKHPAIISTEEFNEVQTLRKQMRGVPRRPGQKAPREYLLTGIVRCYFCGRPMRGSSNTPGTKYYYHDSSRLERISACPQCTLNAQAIEEAFLAWLRKTLGNDQVMSQLQREQDNLELAEKRFERARGLYLAGQLEKSVYDVEVEKLENAKEHLQKIAWSANI
jgi:hypothetical protein